MDERLRDVAQALRRGLSSEDVLVGVERRAKALRRRRRGSALIVALVVASGAGIALRALDRSLSPGRNGATANQGPASQTPQGTPSSAAKLPGSFALIALQHKGIEALYIVNPDGSGLTKIMDNLWAGGVSWSPKGSDLAIAIGAGEGAGQIVVVTAAGGHRTTVTALNNPQEPSWSPSGSMLAFRSTDGDIYLVESSGKGLRQLTNSGPACSDLNPAWSPDSRKIAFNRDCPTSARSNGLDEVSVEGGSPKRIFTPRRTLQGMAWSHDGSTIVFADWIGGLFAISRTGGDPKQLTTGHDSSPTWSPDGNHLAFVRDGQIMVTDAMGVNPGVVPGLKDLKVIEVSWGKAGTPP